MLRNHKQTNEQKQQKIHDIRRIQERYRMSALLPFLEPASSAHPVLSLTLIHPYVQGNR